MSALSEIKDMIAVVSADIEQAQAKLNHSRLAFPNADEWFVEVMDKSQEKINSQREQLANMRKQCEYLEN